MTAEEKTEVYLGAIVAHVAAAFGGVLPYTCCVRCNLIAIEYVMVERAPEWGDHPEAKALAEKLLIPLIEARMIVANSTWSA
jgi:hypothetical protein